MLLRNELEKFKSVLGFDIWQVEKDYLQHLFLLFLSKRIKSELIFKGGTALQKIYGLNRFSIDLDFTLTEEMKLEKILDAIVSDFNIFGFQSSIQKKKENFGETFLLKIKGPLYDGSDRSISTLRIEISLREKVVLKPDIKEVVPVYPDIQPYIIPVMRLEEILAEKVRAVIKRVKARDVYDAWFLLRKGTSIDIKLVNEKLKFYGKSFKKREFNEQLEKVKNVWMTELKPLVGFVPNSDEVIPFIKKSLRR